MRDRIVNNILTTVPESANDADSRTNYNDRSFISLGEEIFDTIDLRSQKSLYGRIDTDNNAIYPNIEKISFSADSRTFGFESSNKLILQFLQDWQNLSFGQISKFSIYKNINVSNSNFRNITESFSQYYQTLLEEHLQVLLFDLDDKKITSFQSYVAHLFDYLKTYNIAITRECLIRTSFFKPDSTGLVYSLQSNTFGNDEQAFVDYINDSAYSLLKQTLIRHALVLDLNSPWQFVVNISAPQITKPAPERGFKGFPKREEFFNTNYVRACETEFEFIKSTLLRGYKDFLLANLRKGAAVCQDTGDVVQFDIPREVTIVTPEANQVVLDFLISVRQNETGTTLTSAEIKSINREKTEQDKYKALHDLIKTKSLVKVKDILSRPDALQLANYIRCKGARKSLYHGWLPCLREEDYLKAIQALPPSKEAVMSKLLKTNKKQPDPILVDSLELAEEQKLKEQGINLDDTEI